MDVELNAKAIPFLTLARSIPILLGACLTLIHGTMVTAREEPLQPNILLILVDDMGAGELGIYGNRRNETPHLDQLAREGVYFKTAYATPSCHPTRMALMTGQYPHHSGVFHFGERAGGPPRSHEGNDDIAQHLSFGQTFQKAGYDTVLAGKWQLSGTFPEQVRETGFDEYLIWAFPENLPPEISPDTLRYDSSFTSPPARYWQPSLVQNGAFIPTTEDDYGPDFFTDFLIDFFERHSGEGAAPFFAYYPMALTHHPYLPTPDSLAPGEDRFAHSMDHWEANVAYMDHLVDRLVTSLDETGLRDNTVIIFMADNGTWKKGKGHTIERGVRVPLIVNAPGILEASGAQDALVDITDLYPTLLELAGLEKAPLQHLDGHSFLPLLENKTFTPREWIYGFLGGRRILRTGRWLLENNTPWGFGQLFDCGDNRDGSGYREITDLTTPEAETARRELTGILYNLPVPEITQENTLLWPREKPHYPRADERTELNSPVIVPLWPEGVPGQVPDPPARQTDGRRYWSIHYPELTIFPAADPLPGAPLILALPGGGYRRNVWLGGGLRMARWLNNQGVTTAILKYRLIEYNYPVQLQDAQRAMRILRSRATEFGGSPNNIGVIGASAGGHLAANLSTAWDLDTGIPNDPLSSISTRPDFQILLYPPITGREPYFHHGTRENILGPNPTPEQIAAFSVDEQVSPQTPPAFIVATGEDPLVPVKNSILYYEALLNQGVPVDLHLYQDGVHGFSAQNEDQPVYEWTALVETWMRYRGFLPRL